MHAVSVSLRLEFVSLHQAALRAALLVVLVIVLAALFMDALPSSRMWSAPQTPALRYNSPCAPIIITC